MNLKQPEGNYFNKYKDNGIVINYIVKNFFNNLNSLIDSIDYSTIYEAGCGEGYISQYIYEYSLKSEKVVDITASDISKNIIEKARLDYPFIQFYVGSIYNIDSNDNNYDLVIACEVLELLEEPEIALSELFRISNKYVLISVPNEPFWRIANFARGKYLNRLGNTPGHINHWSKNGIIDLTSKYGTVLKVKSPFPWTMLLCYK